ncbi:MAG: hypothetical protein AB2669_07950 [Candidatus Thiodiazotropha endolucinida]|nr:hypothetical protein [Candidatus Thiodiazotropha taylori]MCW4249655.1 hypothetical protein [Candidatus Thiodiazotropha endolucinida]MCG7883043.1 hypothetical protein [Candidatus Thiodiazotropha taylori]MCG8058685.1 hypothetical protein [Candidatus Thiodiazotropha taylori]MCG8104623.1 hypothetical protein [Candidatus Thiodiazotropha taylori]
MTQTNTVNSPYSRAIIERTVEFNSLQAQRVMHRSFEKLKQSLFSLSVILRIISDNETEIEKIDAYIDEQFVSAEEDLATEQARLRKVLEDNGIEDLAGYSKPETYKIELDSPRANTFLRLIAQLDNLMLLIDTAWLCGEFDDKQKKNATFQWQQRLIKLAGRIIALEKRARVAATKKGKDEEVQAKAPVDTSETDSEVAAAAEEADADMPELEEAV